MSFREWIETKVETPAQGGGMGPREPKAEPDGRSITVEEAAWAILTKTRDEILQGGSWRSSPETRAAEAEINERYLAVTAGKSPLTAFAVACEKWKRAGTEERAQRGPA